MFIWSAPATFGSGQQSHGCLGCDHPAVEGKTQVLLVSSFSPSYHYSLVSCSLRKPVPIAGAQTPLGRSKSKE